MRFPSLIRLPRNKHFHIETRYYDPIKEDIAERTARIKHELKGKKSDSAHGNISFNRKTKPVPSASLLQLGIAAILGSLVVGWLFYGNEVFYVLYLIIPLYLYFRLRKTKSRR